MSANTRLEELGGSGLGGSGLGEVDEPRRKGRLRAHQGSISRRRAPATALAGLRRMSSWRPATRSGGCATVISDG
jgi:hypothetical protein